MATQKTTTRKTTKAAQGTEEKTQATQPNADGSAQAPEAGQTNAATQQPALVSGDGSGTALPPADEHQQREAHGVDEIPAVFVRTRRGIKSRRRAGFRFTREGHGIALSALSDEQLEQLQVDPALEVEECTFPAEPDGEA